MNNARLIKGIDYGLRQKKRMAAQDRRRVPVSSSVLPRRQLTDDSAILDFLLANVGWFDMYVEDDYAAYVRCSKFARRRNSPRAFRSSSRSGLKLAG